MPPATLIAIKSLGFERQWIWEDFFVAMKSVDMNRVGSASRNFVSVAQHKVLGVISLDMGNTRIKTERFFDAAF